MFKYAFSTTACLLLLACAPRGESKTIEELVQVAQGRVTAAGRSAGQVSPQVLDLRAALDGALNTSSNSETVPPKVLAAIGEKISDLILHSAPTTRPALTELMRQYRALGQAKTVGSDQVKLLVARTMHTVASELETTKFSL